MFIYLFIVVDDTAFYQPSGGNNGGNSKSFLQTCIVQEIILSMGFWLLFVFSLFFFMLFGVWLLLPSTFCYFMLSIKSTLNMMGAYNLFFLVRLFNRVFYLKYIIVFLFGIWFLCWLSFFRNITFKIIRYYKDIYLCFEISSCRSWILQTYAR